jgi:predicted regulator of Ras-like GTPase activity (Roadblock/LC7/MglB family)
MASEFGEILAELVGGIPGAVGAVFVDWDGEAVDQFGHIPEFDIRIIGAHWGAILNLIKNLLRNKKLGAPHLIMFSSEKREVLVQSITAEYFVVLSMKRGSHLGHAIKQLEAVVRALRREMGEIE